MCGDHDTPTNASNLQSNTDYLSDEVDPILAPIINKLIAERPEGPEQIRRAIAQTALGPHPNQIVWGNDLGNEIQSVPAASGVEDSLRDEIAHLKKLLTQQAASGSTDSVPPVAENGAYHRIGVSHPKTLTKNGHHIKTPEEIQACSKIAHARSLREKYVGSKLEPQKGSVACGMVGGIMRVYRSKEAAAAGEQGQYPCLTFKDFFADHSSLVGAVFHGPTKSFCDARLKIMATKFEFHKELNGGLEHEEATHNNSDFYLGHKVDTHIHLAGALPAQTLTRFMRTKFKSHSDDVVQKNGTTLGELAKQMGLDPSTINVNSLDIQADESLFNRFDHFNAKYNPLGNSALRTIFLKSKNDMGGRYFAELARILLGGCLPPRTPASTHTLPPTRLSIPPSPAYPPCIPPSCIPPPVFIHDFRHTASFRTGNFEQALTVHAELRLSIYGDSMSNWPELASWIVGNKLFSESNRYLVQVPPPPSPPPPFPPPPSLTPRRAPAF
jgi:hypothetical protein